jgi:VWFA-related protein
MIHQDTRLAGLKHYGTGHVLIRVARRVMLALLLAHLSLLARGQEMPRLTDEVRRAATPTPEDPVRITIRPPDLAYGDLSIAVSIAEPAVRAKLYVNGLEHSEKAGPSMVFNLKPGMYVRRLRYRVEGLDKEGHVVGQDEITVNDPRPPFRIRAHAPAELPEEGPVVLNASVTAPPDNPAVRVDFFAGEQFLGSTEKPPFSTTFDVSDFDPRPAYVRAVAIARDGQEANDVSFFADRLTDRVDVVVQEVPVSVKGSPRRPLAIEDLKLVDSGIETKIDSLLRASDEPLNVVLLLDSSESMLDELPVLKEAARGFARSILDGRNRIAVVAFAERVWWLTGFTKNFRAIDDALEHLYPRGETHLYDSTIRMLFEIQKMPGRRALVVLTDGANQGGDFELDHVVHYARYSGVPIYPIIQNSLLAKLRYIPLAKPEAERYAEIAEDAGASYFIVRKSSQLPGVYNAIATELKNQYMIRFRVETRGKDIWRPIRLTSGRKDVTLRTPRGYFP